MDWAIFSLAVHHALPLHAKYGRVVRTDGLSYPIRFTVRLLLGLFLSLNGDIRNQPHPLAHPLSDIQTKERHTLA